MITTTTWQHWEYRRFLLATETPGLFGWFTSGEARK